MCDRYEFCFSKSISFDIDFSCSESGEKSCKITDFTALGVKLQKSEKCKNLSAALLQYALCTGQGRQSPISDEQLVGGLCACVDDVGSDKIPDSEVGPQNEGHFKPKKQISFFQPLENLRTWQKKTCSNEAKLNLRDAAQSCFISVNLPSMTLPEAFATLKCGDKLSSRSPNSNGIFLKLALSKLFTLFSDFEKIS